MEGKMKLTRNLVIGLAVMLAWVNLVASQERPKRPAAPKLPAGVKVLRDLQYVENVHKRSALPGRQVKVAAIAIGFGGNHAEVKVGHRTLGDGGPARC